MSARGLVRHTGLEPRTNRSATHAFVPRLAQRATSSGRRSPTYPAVSNLPSASVRARAALATRTVAEPATARTSQPATARTPGKINRGVGYGALVVARALGPQRSAAAQAVFLGKQALKSTFTL